MSRKSNWFLIVALALLTLAIGMVPLLIIQPFKHQQPDQLQFALLVRRWAPYLAVLFVVGSLASSYKLRRWPAYLATVLTIAFATISFINVFEIMFHPIDQPTFADGAEAKLDPEDMLLTVKLGDQSRAYPVRTLAYHHLVNDRLNDEPIVATY